MKTLHVWPESPQASDEEVNLRAVFEGFDSGKKTIDIAVQRPALPRLPSRSDHFALAAVFPAMRSFDACVVHGEVSRPLLANLSEFNAIWQAWRPQTYRQVQWEADKVAGEPFVSEQRSGHLLAFSGGLDSTVSLRRHTLGNLGWRKLHIAGALMVHGFDIPVSDAEGFRRAREKAARITSTVGVPLISARTNLRELPDDWEDAFAAKLAAILHVFNETHEGAIFASGRTYAFPELPWGSNPVSDHLLGTCVFPVRTDGAEHTRLEKVKLVSEWEVAVNHIRVCWEGKVPGENCGVCEKCVRTQLELAAFGVTPRGNFKARLRPGMVAGIRLRNEAQLSDFSEILAYADRNHISAWWTEELRKVVRRGCGSSIRFRALRQSRPWRLLRQLMKPGARSR